MTPLSSPSKRTLPSVPSSPSEPPKKGDYYVMYGFFALLFLGMVAAAYSLLRM